MEGIQLSLFGKTLQEHSVAVMGVTFKPCWKKSQKPIFQCLQVEDGQTPEWFEGAEYASPGDCSTLNIGASPSVASESTLSEVLEAIVPKKYYLSRTACKGILRRAARRGKVLPKILENALKAIAESSTAEDAVTTAGHNSRVSDFSAVVCEPTIAIRDPSAVCYAIGNGQVDNTRLSDKTDALDCMHDQQAVMYREQNYLAWVVRRLTPLECERLQGYPDGWTVLPKIEDMSEEEYDFFIKVYLLDKKIRGQAVKKLPTREQLVRWYNKLDSDGTRYRQIGNSLAIPCALRVIGYIADYIREKEISST